MQTTGFLKAFWRLTKPYWVSSERAKGLTLLATVVGLALMAVYMEVQFNNWNNDFYNTLQDKDQAEFFRQLGKFTLLAFTWIIIVVYQRVLPADAADRVAHLAHRALPRRLDEGPGALPHAALRAHTRAPTTQTSASPTTCASSSTTRCRFRSGCSPRW